MSVKQLETEFRGLHTVFLDLTTKIDTLLQNFENLGKKYEKSLSRKKNVIFKCKNCGDKFENVKEFQKHKQENKSCHGTFQCDECEKTFKIKQQLEDHVKIHTKYPCDDCDKVFNYEVTLQRHVEAAHESCELFCHYYNNNKDCPYNDQCVFIHEESDECKYGKACERMLCMFKHDESDDEAESDDDEEDSEDEEEEDEDETVDEIKPSLEKVRDALEKINALLKKVSPNFKCQHCEFEGKNQNGLNMHMKSKHPNKSQTAK